MQDFVHQPYGTSIPETQIPKPFTLSPATLLAPSKGIRNPIWVQGPLGESKVLIPRHGAQLLGGLAASLSGFSVHRFRTQGFGV